jgi:hypothetical protein
MFRVASLKTKAKKIYDLEPPQELAWLLLSILFGPLGSYRCPLGSLLLVAALAAITLCLGNHNLGLLIPRPMPSLLALLIAEPLPITIRIEVSSAVLTLHGLARSTGTLFQFDRPLYL